MGRILVQGDVDGRKVETRFRDRVQGLGFWDFVGGSRWKDDKSRPRKTKPKPRKGLGSRFMV